MGHTAVEIPKAEATSLCVENRLATALLAEAETSIQREVKIVIADAIEIEPAKEVEMGSEAAKMVSAAEIPDLREGESEVHHAGNSVRTASPGRETNRL